MLFPRKDRLNDLQLLLCEILDDYGILYETRDPEIGQSEFDVIVLPYQEGDALIFSNMEVKGLEGNRNALKRALGDLSPKNRGFNPRFQKKGIRTTRSWFLSPQSR